MPSPQRMPTRERMVSGIQPGDTRVSIVGTVVDANGGILAVDDGTGKIDVSFEEPASATAGQMVRVFGRLMPTEGGFELQGEALQDFSGADVKLWRRVSELWEGSLNQL